MTHKVTFVASLLVGLALAPMTPTVVHAQPRVEIYHHSSTALGDILRAKADAIVALRQAELIHERAIAQRLENLIRECDVVYKRFTTRNQMQTEHREHEFSEKFDHIKFNQQLAEIRSQLEIKAAMEHKGIGNLSDEMNLLLEKFTQSSFNKYNVAAMQTELSPEQLQAIYLTDGSNVFSAVGGKTHVEQLVWPYLMEMAAFDADRQEFEKLYGQAMEESAEKGRPRPETVIALLEKKSDLERLIATIKLSSKADLQRTETKWRTEATNYLKQVTDALNSYSTHDSERLTKYAFSGKTVGDLLEHMVGKGLRFANPKKEDRNLYASVYFLMRFAFKDVPAPVGLMTPSPSRGTVDSRQVYRITLTLSESGEGTFQIEKALGEPADDFPGTPIRLARWPHTRATRGEQGMFRLIHDFADPDDLGTISTQHLNVTLPQGSGELTLTPLPMPKGIPIEQGALFMHRRWLQPPITVVCDLSDYGDGGVTLKLRDPRNSLGFLQCVLRSNAHNLETPFDFEALWWAFQREKVAPTHTNLVSKRGVSLGQSFEARFRCPLPNTGTSLPFVFELGRIYGNRATAVSRLEVRGRLTPHFGLQLGNNQGTIFAKSVISDGLADSAGLQRGDMILAINGQRLRETGEAVALLSRLPFGEETVFAIRRGDKPLEIRVIAE